VSVLDTYGFFLFEDNATISVTGNDRVAVDKYLTFDFGADDGGIFSLATTNPVGTWCNGSGGQDTCPQGLTLFGAPPDESTNPFSETEILAAVPEPSTWAMMLLGLVGLGYAGYRRARQPRTAALAQ
jgi:hypothetical protein